jgi:hypothetical protein
MIRDNGERRNLDMNPASSSAMTIDRFFMTDTSESDRSLGLLEKSKAPLDPNRAVQGAPSALKRS